MTAPKPDPLDLESQVCFALSRASRAVIQSYRPVLEPLGLTHPQYLVMLALWQHDGLSLKHLSELLALDPGTLSPLVRRLESIGYLTRRRGDVDERMLAIVLTPEGRALRAKAENIPTIMVRRLGLRLADIEAQRDLMNTLIAGAAAAPDLTDEERALLTPSSRTEAKPRA